MMFALPVPVQDFCLHLADACPGATCQAEPPFHSGRGWWLDVCGLPVLFADGRGFGLFAMEDEEPSLWILNAAQAAVAVVGRLPVTRFA